MATVPTTKDKRKVPKPQGTLTAPTTKQMTRTSPGPPPDLTRDVEVMKNVFAETQPLVTGPAIKNETDTATYSVLIME